MLAATEEAGTSDGRERGRGWRPRRRRLGLADTEKAGASGRGGGASRGGVVKEAAAKEGHDREGGRSWPLAALSEQGRKGVWHWHVDGEGGRSGVRGLLRLCWAVSVEFLSHFRPISTLSFLFF